MCKVNPQILIIYIIKRLLILFAAITYFCKRKLIENIARV